MMGVGVSEFSKENHGNLNAPDRADSHLFARAIEKNRFLSK
jgi:hypothetical protein